MEFRVATRASRLVRRTLTYLALTPFLLGVTSIAANAEIKSGDVVPVFSLKSTDGLLYSLDRRDGTIILRHGTKKLEPSIVIIHLFQPDCMQCRAQLKVLEALYQEYGKRSVIVIGVAHRGEI